MNIIGISVSPRRHGNSETLLDHALAGARLSGAGTKKIILSELNIKPCNGSTECDKKAKCFIKDDMAKVLEVIHNADVIILSSPVYFGSIPAQLKAMIDRCQPLWVKKYILKKNRPRIKKGLFLCISSHTNRNFFRNSKEIVDIFFKVLDVESVDSRYFPGLEDKNEAKHNTLLLKKANQCGIKLVLQ
jgi:multimeric flavodoxin WrbA